MGTAIIHQPATRLAARLAAGELSAVELLQACLARTRAVDGRGLSPPGFTPAGLRVFPHRGSGRALTWGGAVACRPWPAGLCAHGGGVAKLVIASFTDFGAAIAAPAG